jgi:abequosyltransferase
MTNPLISICIPSYNRTDELKRLLNSIDCDPSIIEVVICEDFSPSRSEIKSIVDLYSISSKYLINYYENDVNLGFDGNLRRLAEHAKGKYILFMGDDDLFLPNALDKFIYFLKKHQDIPYVLRSYVVLHNNGNLEYFRYLPKTQFLPEGETAVAWLIKRSVTICGFTISKKAALKFSTNDLDGTLLYHVYLMARVCLFNKSIYYDLPFVKCSQEFRKNKPMFGNSKSEKNRYTPGAISSDNSINFTKAYFELTAYLDKIYGTNLTRLVLLDLSKYSYPFLSIQRKNGLKTFFMYASRLDKELGFGCTLYFYFYKWALIFFGEKICDWVIIKIKRFFGFTPNL